SRSTTSTAASCITCCGSLRRARRPDAMFTGLFDRFRSRRGSDRPGEPGSAGETQPQETRRRRRRPRRIAGAAIVFLLLVLVLLGVWWSREPRALWVAEETPDGRTVVGYATADTLTQTLTWL